MNYYSFPDNITPEQANDSEYLWLIMQDHFLKRISNPPHKDMENYLKPHISQEDFNFLCEMDRIQEDYTHWVEKYQVEIAPPEVLTNEAYRTKRHNLICRSYTLAYQELQNHDKIETD